MKILCPYHTDTNPSMHCYQDTAYCFVCSKTVAIEEVLNADEIQRLKTQVPEKENVEETIRYIKTLPKIKVRGLDLHTGRYGYYIVWPDNQYYKLRRYDDSPRYVGPRGIRPPLFSLGRNKKTLVLVEGEINAISLHQSVGSDLLHVVSPGSASGLMDERTVNYSLQFESIYIIMDLEPSGPVSFGIELKKVLQSRGKKVTLILLTIDFNQLLQNGGSEAVTKQFIKELGLC